MGTIKDIIFLNVTTLTHTLNSLNVYKGPVHIHPPFQTSSSRSWIVRQNKCCPSLLLDQHMVVTQSLAAPEQTATPPSSTTFGSAPIEKVIFHPNPQIYLDPCQFSDCWWDGWICACPVCTTRTASDLHVEDSLLFHLKVPKKRNKRN